MPETTDTQAAVAAVLSVIDQAASAAAALYAREIVDPRSPIHRDGLQACTFALQFLANARSNIASVFKVT